MTHLAFTHRIPPGACLLLAFGLALQAQTTRPAPARPATKPVAKPLDTAQNAMQAGDYVTAERTLRAELQLRPGDGETISLLGLALDGQKRLREADTTHHQALAAAPRSARVMGRYGQHLAYAGDEKGAQEAFRLALQLDPADRYANIQMAQFALATKDPAHGKEALAYLDHLPAAQREAPDVAVLRLTALELAGNARDAEALFQRVSAATQKDAKLSASIGWSLTQAGQFERAETFLTHALAADPSDFHVLYDLGVVALYARHYQRAKEVLETAVRQQPENVDALYSLAFATSALRQPEPTLRVLAQAARLAPSRADIQRLIAVTAGELDAFEDSAIAWDRYSTLAPNDDSARRERGFARIHLRQFETGLADLEWYVSRHPEDPVGHYELGLAQSTNDPTRGLGSLDKALELKPDLVAARSARGALYYLQGKPEAAVPDLEAAATAEPNSAMILDRLGQAYRALDRLPDSIKALRRAATLDPAESTIQLHLASALAEAGETAESESLMGRYRQMRPPQAPRDLMRYLSLTPEQQRADYRARVEKAVRDNSGDMAAQLRYLTLSLEDGQMAQAATTARLIADAKPGAAVLADAGRALLEARQYELAHDLLEKAATADPGAGLELDLAIATFRTAGPDAGLAQLGKVSEAKRTADYFLARTQMLDGAAKATEAIAAIEKAISLSPNRAGLYWQAAVLMTRNNRGADATQLLDRAAKLLPQDPQIPLTRAILLELAGKSPEAKTLLDGVQRRWPEGSAVWVARGTLEAAHGQYPAARQSLETAVSLGARSPEAFYLLAEATLRTAPNHLSDAEAAITRAIALSPGDAHIHALAGQIAYRKGDFTAAMEHQRTAIRLNPKWAEPHTDLAKTYTALNRKAEATAEQAIFEATQKETPAPKADPLALFQNRPPQDW